MKKSTGKWIKSMFGKKSTFSESVNGGKEELIVSKVSSDVVASYDPVISNPQPIVVYRNGHFESGNQILAEPPGENVTLLAGSHDNGIKSLLTPADKSVASKEEKAAAKVQAALRGFLARRAFRALKGIIRHQALIRGHLVRRQAVATLHCMQGIIKVQALVRGQIIRLDVKRKCNLQKLKLLASSTRAMPLSLHYDTGDVNSVWNWLERWSSSHFWEMVMEPKRDNGLKASRKSGSSKGRWIQNGPKCGVRKNTPVNHDSPTEYGMSSGKAKKSIRHQAGPTRKNSQNEPEKAKHNTRKVSYTKSDTKSKPEAETLFDKPMRKTSKMLTSQNPVIPEQRLTNSAQKHYYSTNSISDEKQIGLSKTTLEDKNSGLSNAIAKEPKSDSVIPLLQEVDILEISGTQPDEPSCEPQQQLIEKVENSAVDVEQSHSKEDLSGKENQKAGKRKSLSAKHDTEYDSHNTPSLPSYMQATKSAKAKLKAQASSMLSQDTPENGVVRRHSQPSSGSGKLNTPSTRIQKLVQGSPKGGNKDDVSLLASKDFNSNERITELRS